MLNQRIYPDQVSPFTNLQHRRHLAAYAFAAKMAKGKTVIDAGCGAGYGAAYLSDYAAMVIGIDSDPGPIIYATEHYRKSNLKFLEMDIEKLGFPESSFDLITSFQVIEHLKNPDNFLQSAKSLLKTDGTLLLTTPNKCLRLKEGEKPWNPFHVHEYSPHELDLLLRRYLVHVDIMGLFGKNNAQELEVTRANPHTEKYRFRTTYDHLQNIIVAVDIFGLRQLFPKNMRNNVTYFLRERAEKSRQALSDRIKLSDFYIDVREVDQALDIVAICRK